MHIIWQQKLSFLNDKSRMVQQGGLHIFFQGGHNEGGGRLSGKIMLILGVGAFFGAFQGGEFACGRGLTPNPL